MLKISKNQIVPGQQVIADMSKSGKEWSDIEIQENGTWTRKTYVEYPIRPQKGDFVKVFIEEELRTYEVKEVVIESGRTPILRVG